MAMSRFWNIIPHSFRRRTVGVVMTIFLRAILNFVGVATLIPILILIVDSNNIATTGSLNWLYNRLHLDSYETFSMVVCLGVIAIIVIKNIAVVYLYRFERDYIYSLYKHLSERLYASYYHKGLGFIKHSNTAILTRNVNVVSLIFATNILKPIATIIGEGLLMLLMFAALVLYSPMIALITVGLFLPIVALFYFSMRKRLNSIGDKENAAQRAKGRIVAETFRGFADIEINNAFPLTMSNFSKAIDEAVKLRKEYATISMLPQMFTEVGLAIGLTVIIIVSLYSSSDNLVILLGIFAIAGVRLLPSLRTIMASWSSIRYNRYTIDTLIEADLDEVQTTTSPTTDRFNFEHSIELRNLGFKFEDSDTELLNNLSLTIHKGERIGITGASGVGKTTLFNIILGLYRPTSGAIFVDGEELSDSNIRKWQNSIGYVSQSVFIADSTLLENIALGYDSTTIDLERINRVIELADLGEFVASLPDGINSRIGEQGSKISGGQRQRIGIARALYKDSDILFFDEATSSLDNKTEENINKAIQNLSLNNSSLTIVIIAHRESSLEYCDRIITLE